MLDWGIVGHAQCPTSVWRWDPSQLTTPLPRTVLTEHLALAPLCLLVSSQTGPGREMCAPLPGECYLILGVKGESTELVHKVSPGKNTGVGCYALLQGIFLPRDRTQVSCIASGFFTI